MESRGTTFKCGGNSVKKFNTKSAIPSAVYILAILIGAAIGSIIGGFFFMLIWNWVVVALFGLPPLTFLQAWGLSFLLSLIFGWGR